MHKPVLLEKLNDKWLRLIGIPLVELSTNLLYLEQYHYDWGVYLRTSFWGMVYISLIWECFTRWLRFVRLRYTHIDQTRQRILITFLGYFMIVTAAQVGIVSLFGLLGIAGVPITVDVYLQQLIGGYLVLLVVGVAYEVLYYFSRLKTALVEAEMAKKASLQHQYDTLKAQVNPHFLFNSLNSLSILIEDEPEKASEFLDELCTVYRYLLQANSKPTTSVRQEIAFINSFYNLLQVRYGEAIQLQIAVDRTVQEAGQLPPLTLQTLVENAINYNVLTPKAPLIIRIRNDEAGQLIVENTINRKTLRINPGRNSLVGLISQFRLQGFADPVIIDNEYIFSVTINLGLNRKTGTLFKNQTSMFL